MRFMLFILLLPLPLYSWNPVLNLRDYPLVETCNSVFEPVSGDEILYGPIKEYKVYKKVEDKNKNMVLKLFITAKYEPDGLLT